MTKRNTKIHETAPNATLGIDAIQEREILSSSKRLKYLEICIKAHESLTEALAALKFKTKS